MNITEVPQSTICRISALSCAVLAVMIGAVALVMALQNGDSVTFFREKGVIAALCILLLAPVVFAVVGYVLGFVVRLLVTPLSR